MIFITHLTEVKRIIKEIIKNKQTNNYLPTNQINLGKMDKFLGRHKLLKLTPSKRNGKCE